MFDDDKSYVIDGVTLNRLVNIKSRLYGEQAIEYDERLSLASQMDNILSNVEGEINPLGLTREQIAYKVRAQGKPLVADIIQDKAFAKMVESLSYDDALRNLSGDHLEAFCYLWRNLVFRYSDTAQLFQL